MSFPKRVSERTQRRDHRTSIITERAPPQSIRGSRHAVGEFRAGCQSRARDEDAKESGTVQTKEEVEVGTAKGPAELVTRGTKHKPGHLGGRTTGLLVGFADRVEAVLEDQASRGQLLKFTEAEARARFPNLVVASLGAQRKDKPNGVVSARVLFDGTHGLAVITRTRIRDQERTPIAAA